VARQIRSQLALSGAFAGASAGYWLDVFPRASAELRHWRARASAIPDPGLRRVALRAHHAERGNVEGAAAYAILATRGRRAGVVRAAVAFQAAYDYLDALAEQPTSDPAANGRQLHLALGTALDPDAAHADYYARLGAVRDGGYLHELLDTCRHALAALPSAASVAAPLGRAAGRMAAYQARCHALSRGGRELGRWAVALTPAALGLHWWEAAAAAASSLGVFALLAAAAAPNVGERHAALLERAYFPWIGALHVLLDSLVDAGEDRRTGHRSLIACYQSPEELAARLRWLAERARAAAARLPAGARHVLLLTAMSAFYLSRPEADAPGLRGARRRVLEAIGPLVLPSIGILRARRAAAHAHECARRLRRPASPTRQRRSRVAGGRSLRRAPAQRPARRLRRRARVRPADTPRRVPAPAPAPRTAARR
jgi:tetraprenyl-beta-curcumene synthase